MDKGYFLEARYEIRNDKSGEHIEIGLDRNGFDLIEIQSFDDTGVVIDRITLTQEEAALVAVAIGKLSPGITNRM